MILQDSERICIYNRLTRGCLVDSIDSLAIAFFLKLMQLRQGKVQASVFASEAEACLDADSRLIILISREDLRLFGGHSAVSVDNFGHYPSGCLDAHREGANIHQKNILDL